MLLFLYFVILALTGMVVASPIELRSNLLKRDTLNCADSGQSQFASDAITEAKALATGALNYMNANGMSDSLFQTYFGAGNGTLTDYTGVFTSAMNEDSGTWNCVDPFTACANTNNPASSYGAYNTEGDINLCPSFYNQVPDANLCAGTSIDSGTIRSGTALSEILLTVSGRVVNRTGCSASRGVTSDPAVVRQNADSYSCFAMQVFINSGCPSL